MHNFIQISIMKRKYCQQSAVLPPPSPPTQNGCCYPGSLSPHRQVNTNIILHSFTLSLFSSLRSPLLLSFPSLSLLSLRFFMYFSWPCPVFPTSHLSSFLSPSIRLFPYFLPLLLSMSRHPPSLLFASFHCIF